MITTAQSLIDVIRDAQNAGTAVGHFNIADLALLKGVFEAARAINVPVIVGASQGEQDFMGTRQLAALVKSLREEFDFPVFLNADHTHSLAKAVDAVKAGFDSIVFDLSSLPLEENARQTRDAVEHLKSINPSVLIEGEIGDIGTGSEIHEDAPSQTRPLTTPGDTRHFAETTRIDILAPAVGNMHGMHKSMVSGRESKHLDIGRISEIKAATGLPPHSTWLWNCGSGSEAGDSCRDQHCAYQHRAPSGVETRFGARARGAGRRSRPL